MKRKAIEMRYFLENYSEWSNMDKEPQKIKPGIGADLRLNA